MNIPRGRAMFKVIETFSGIGAQAKALQRIRKPYKIINTCEWDINAMIAYCQIHKGGINTGKYDRITDESVDSYLKQLSLSFDGKTKITDRAYNRLSMELKRVIYAVIKETNNLVSITDVKGGDICPGVDLLTYSFPCQDLSLCGCWHGNKSGISREAHNRSGMLWEVERILKEMYEQKIELPHFLVMENVTNILSSTHREDFNGWQKTLNSLGYYNKIYRLNAKNFGVPQKRERAYMISVLLGDDDQKKEQVEKYFEKHNLENEKVAEKIKSRSFKLKDVLRLDYTVEIYKEEANANQPNKTPSRDKIEEENDMLFDGKKINEIFVNTVTTKQDRNPNSGLITYRNWKRGKEKWRYLTPRECFMLMGFDEYDYTKAVSYNPIYDGKNRLLTNEKMIKMAGNSICVDVLEAIFRQIMKLDKRLFKV